MPKPDLRAGGAEIAQAIEQAAAHLRAGRLADADKICAHVLKARPDYFDALHLAGMIKLESGRPGAGLALIEAALKINPNVPQALGTPGLALA